MKRHFSKQVRLGIVLLLFCVSSIPYAAIANSRALSQTEYTAITAEEALADASYSIFQCYQLLMELERWGGSVAEYIQQLNPAIDNLSLAYASFYSQDYENTTIRSLAAFSTAVAMHPVLQTAVSRQIVIQWVNLILLPVFAGIILTVTIVLLGRSMKQKKRSLKKQVYAIKIRRLSDEDDEVKHTTEAKEGGKKID